MPLALVLAAGLAAEPVEPLETTVPDEHAEPSVRSGWEARRRASRAALWAGVGTIGAGGALVAIGFGSYRQETVHITGQDELGVVEWEPVPERNGWGRPVGFAGIGVAAAGVATVFGAALGETAALRQGGVHMPSWSQWTVVGLSATASAAMLGSGIAALVEPGGEGPGGGDLGLLFGSLGLGAAVGVGAIVQPIVNARAGGEVRWVVLPAPGGVRVAGEF